MLKAANGDPLRAQEIEANVSEYWWAWLLVYWRGGPEGHYLSGGPGHSQE